MKSLSILGECWLLMRQNKKWWLLPLVATLLVLGIVMVAASGSALAPFIYTIF
jgi:uncharacterized protein DUF5989